MAENVTSRRVTALLAGSGLALSLVSMAIVLVTSTQTAHVAANAQELHWTNAAAGSSAVARAAVSQAVVFSVDYELGVADAEARDAAITEANHTIDAIERHGITAPSGSDAASAVDDLEHFVETARAVVAQSASDPPRARRDFTEVFEPQYQTLAAALASAQQTIAARIDEGERRAGMLGLVTQVFATLLIPVAAILLYFLLARRQVREARLQMQAKLEAERALSRAKDEFIAGVSHELRTPLTGIYGFSEYLLEQGIIDPDEALELVGHINHEASELSRMVEDLLSAARLDADTLNLQDEDVDLADAAEQIAAPLRRLGHPITVNGDDVVAFGDAARIRQVIRNLVSNAIKHGGPTIRVRLTAEGDVVKAAVLDDGPGVGDHVADRLFERFTNEGADSLLAGSVGLGLSIARTLARRMGGDVSYRRTNEWTVFEVTLPRAEAPQHAKVELAAIGGGQT